MKSIENIPFNETSIDEWMKQVRQYFSHMLKEYLRMYKKFDQIKTNVRDEKMLKFLDPDIFNYYDEKGKVNWEIIRRFMPQDMEEYIRRRYNILNNNEIRLCFLLFFGVSKRVIANILPYNDKSIKTIQCRIKKKTGMNDVNDICKTIFLSLPLPARKMRNCRT